MIVKLLTEHRLELKRRLQRLVRVYTSQNATLLEIICHGSINVLQGDFFSSYMFYFYVF